MTLTPAQKKAQRKLVKAHRTDNKANKLKFKKRKSSGSPDRRRGAGTR